MNLRQKVKQAKKELKIVEEKYSGSSTWDIVQKFQAKSRLQKIIDYKRKPSRFLHWNEEHEIDWEKLTYISLQADFNELLKVETPNGRPFTKQRVEEFLRSCRMKIYEHGVKIQQKESGEKRYTDYVFFVSDDRTKQKRFHPQKFCRQYHGDDKLYPYND